jgi:hypothetical protein
VTARSDWAALAVADAAYAASCGLAAVAPAPLPRALSFAFWLALLLALPARSASSRGVTARPSLRHALLAAALALAMALSPWELLELAALALGSRSLAAGVALLCLSVAARVALAALAYGAALGSLCGLRGGRALWLEAGRACLALACLVVVLSVLVTAPAGAPRALSAATDGAATFAAYAVVMRLENVRLLGREGP